MDDELTRALATFDLAPGATWLEVLARYRQAAKTWHPDRFRTTAEKAAAEEKLKKIIAAREILQRHYFSREHAINLCTCAELSEAIKTAPIRPPKQAPKHQPPPPSPTSFTTAAKKPSPPDQPWDWLSRFCKSLDIGELTHDEPGWWETLRRLYDKVYGKHPGEAVLGNWDKPINWSKEHKKRCFLFALLALLAFEHFNLAGAKEQSENLPEGKSEEQKQKMPPLRPELQRRRQVEAESRYFEQKWQERQRLLERIRPGYEAEP